MYRVFPERTIIETLLNHGGSLDIEEVANHSGLSSKEVGQSIRWLDVKNWATKEGRVLTLTDVGRLAAESGDLGPDEILVNVLALDESKWFTESEIIEMMAVYNKSKQEE